MALSWEKMNEGSDQVILPPSDRKMLDKTHFMEISYKQNDDGTIVRLCRKGEITKKEKRVSRAASARRANFAKFGTVSDKAIGFIEKGITEIRIEEFGVLWEGLSKQEQKNKMKQKNRANSSLNRQSKRSNDSSMQQSQSTMASQQKPERRGYIAPGLRTLGMAGYKAYEEEEEITFEIRISNLPDTATQDDIRNIMFAFFDNEYHTKPYREKRQMLAPPSGRIKVYCFKSRIEQDVNAIVDVKSEFWQKQAIEMLDGQSYGYNIIKVEKSKPKRRKY